MKNPREVLLEKHRAIQPALDRIRAEVMAAEVSTLRCNTPTPSSKFGATPTRGRDAAGAWAIQFWQELIWPSRRIWAALATVWIGLLATNAATGGARESTGARINAQPEAIAAFAEQKRVLAELLASPQATESQRPLPRPRTEVAMPWKKC